MRKKKCLVNKCNFCKYEKKNTLGVRLNHNDVE